MFSHHAVRVSALAAEFALRAALHPRDQQLAANAALLIDIPKQRLNLRAVGPLFVNRLPKVDSHVFVRYMLELIRTAEASDASLGLRGPRDPIPDLIAAAETLVSAYEPYLEREEDPGDAVRAWFRRRKEEGLHSRRAYDAFLKLPTAKHATLVESASRVSVYPAIAMKAMAKAATEDTTLTELAALAAQDQTIAGNLIKAANSALNPALARVATIRHAIAYVGLEQTRRILTAAALRPLFASRTLAQLWHHSLTVAKWCESLARSTAAINPEEAFLCGLVHDVGRLAMQSAPGDAPVTLQRFKEHGCDMHFAELLLFGCTHAQLGGEILAIWQFPEHLTYGVAGHHGLRRNASRFSAMLCLAESACLNDENTPSSADQSRALEILGLPEESILSNRADLGALAALTIAA